MEGRVAFPSANAHIAPMADLSETDQFKIDVFSDPNCPWCLLGLTRLNNALQRVQSDQPPAVLHHPFLLDPDAPEEGENVVEMLTSKYGREPFEMWDRIEAEAHSSGLDLDMRKQTMRYPSQKAQVLIQAAALKGTQHELAVAFSHACYLDAKDISSAETLKELGTTHGFTEEEVDRLTNSEGPAKQVEAAAAQASQAGISGVPFFIFNNSFALSGAQPEAVFDQAVGMAARGEVPEAAQ